MIRILKVGCFTIVGLFALVFAALMMSDSGSPGQAADSHSSATSSLPTPVMAAPSPVTPRVSNATFEKAMRQMRVKTDDIEGTKFYYDKSSPKYVNRNAFYAYVGQREGREPSLFLEIQYYGDEWLFIEKFKFNVDGAKFEIDPGPFGMNRDNNSKVWEWYNEAASDEDLALLDRIAHSKKSKMRLDGSQYRRDVTITSSQKAALRRVLNVYYGLLDTYEKQHA